jgi:hypothetical protein
MLNNSTPAISVSEYQGSELYRVLHSFDWYGGRTLDSRIQRENAIWSIERLYQHPEEFTFALDMQRTVIGNSGKIACVVMAHRTFAPAAWSIYITGTAANPRFTVESPAFCGAAAKQVIAMVKNEIARRTN